MGDGRTEIRSFTMADWPQVRALIGEHLGASHPILREELFFWQYEGFGPRPDHHPFKLLYVDDQLRGLRGAIPVVHQVPREDRSVRITPGAAMAMWLLTPDLRGQGFGYALLQALQDESPVITVLGSNDISSPIYRRNGWSRLDALHHWFRPLETEGFLEVAFGPWSTDEVREWSSTGRAEPVSPSRPDPQAMEALWRSTGQASALFGLHRSGDFWSWRYMNHPEFDYLFFGDPQALGVVIGRIEECRPTGPNGPSRRVLRVIEVVPARLTTWSGEPDEAMTAVLAGVLEWARGEGCSAADHRCSTLRLRRVLADAGFAEHREERPDADGRGFAGLLNPFRAEPEPINAHWRIAVQPGDRTIIPADDVYLVKSDSDLDRPNDRRGAGGPA